MIPKVLVVDDEESIRFTFECFLQDEGYQVSTARNADEALSQIVSTDFDLMFIDILLAGASGVDLLRRFRELNQLSPAIMITGFPALETATEALRLGAYDYIPKPVTQETLLRVARMALRYKQLDMEKKRHQAHLAGVFRSVRDAIITVDEHLRIVAFNEAAQRLCRLTVKNIGEDFSLKRSGCNACLQAVRDTVQEKKPKDLSRLECRADQGETRIVDVNSNPLVDELGEFFGAVLVLRDETRLHQLEKSLRVRSCFHKIVGSSTAMQTVYELIERLALVPTTVLITGESGTGKELIAEALHEKSPRRHAPLIRVNCSALTENLLESELFGHVKGAFTGAIKDTPGRFEKADGGTIFLDEIGDISPRLQVRLLRVLQEKTIERVGDATSIPVNVRVVAATHQDLAEKIRRGEFREDLFYRLKVVNVVLPSLRQRRSDIPLLTQHFIEKFNVKFTRNIQGVSQSVAEFFLKYPWPGNIRELENALEHACVVSRSDILTLDHLPTDMHAANAGASFFVNERGKDFDEAIREALLKTDGNKAKAARLLGISRRTLYRKLG